MVRTVAEEDDKGTMTGAPIPAGSSLASAFSRSPTSCRLR